MLVMDKTVFASDVAGGKWVTNMHEGVIGVLINNARCACVTSCASAPTNGSGVHMVFAVCTVLPDSAAARHSDSYCTKESNHRRPEYRCATNSNNTATTHVCVVVIQCKHHTLSLKLYTWPVARCHPKPHVVP